GSVPPTPRPPEDPKPAPGQIDFAKLPATPPGAPPVPVGPALTPDGQVPPPAPWVTKPAIPHGVIVGNLLASIRVKSKEPGKEKETEEVYLLHPGDEVTITTVRGGKLAPAYDHFLVVDYFKSEMSEYDSNY